MNTYEVTGFSRQPVTVEASRVSVEGLGTFFWNGEDMIAHFPPGVAVVKVNSPGAQADQS